MNVLLRTCTMKSVLGFGYLESVRDTPIKFLIETGRGYHLIRIYYELAKIDFDEEVKRELGITKDREIVKPGKLLHSDAINLINLCYADYKLKYENVIMHNGKELKKMSDNYKAVRELKGYHKDRNRALTNANPFSKRW